MLSRKQPLIIDFNSIKELATAIIEDNILLSEFIKITNSFQIKIEKLNKLIAFNTSIDELKPVISNLIDELTDENSPFLLLNKKNHDSTSASVLRSAHQKIKSALIDYKTNNFKTIAQPVLESLSLSYQQNLLKNDSKVATAFKNALRKIQQMHFSKFVDIYISHAEVNNHGEAYNPKGESAWILPFLETLKKHLISAGMHVKLMPSDLQAGSNIFTFMESLNSSSHVLHIGTSSLLKRHASGADPIVHTELNYIRRRINKGLLPILIEATPESSFPVEFINYSTMKNWRDSKTYFLNLCELIEQLYDIKDKSLKPIWSEFLNSIDKETRFKIAPEYSDENTVNPDKKQESQSNIKEAAVHTAYKSPIEPAIDSKASQHSFSSEIQRQSPPLFHEILDTDANIPLPPPFDEKSMNQVPTTPYQFINSQPILPLQQPVIHTLVPVVIQPLPSITMSPNTLFSSTQSTVEKTFENNNAELNLKYLPDELQKIYDKIINNKIEQKRILNDAIKSMQSCTLVKNQLIILVDAYNAIRTHEEKQKGILSILSSTQFVYKDIGNWFKTNKLVLNKIGFEISKHSKKISLSIPAQKLTK